MEPERIWRSPGNESQHGGRSDYRLIVLAIGLRLETKTPAAGNAGH